MFIVMITYVDRKAEHMSFPHMATMPDDQGTRACLSPMVGQVSLVIAEPNHLFREGLNHILSSNGEWVVTGEVAGPEDIVQTVKRVKPHVVIMDIDLPVDEGLAAIGEIVRDVPSCSVLVLTALVSSELAIAALRAGAMGYILKTARKSDLLKAVSVLANGGSALDPVLAADVLRAYHRILAGNEAASPNDHQLTKREQALLRLLANGYNNRQISSELNLAESTVKNNLSSLFRKVGVRDRTQAVLFAIKEGIVSPPATKTST